MTTMKYCRIFFPTGVCLKTKSTFLGTPEIPYEKLGCFLNTENFQNPWWKIKMIKMQIICLSFNYVTLWLFNIAMENDP